MSHTKTVYRLGTDIALPDGVVGSVGDGETSHPTIVVNGDIVTGHGYIDVHAPALGQEFISIELPIELNPIRKRGELVYSFSGDYDTKVGVIEVIPVGGYDPSTDPERPTLPKLLIALGSRAPLADPCAFALAFTYVRCTDLRDLVD